MREITLTSQFKRDHKKRSRDKGLDALLEDIVTRLADGKSLDARWRDHSLKEGICGLPRMPSQARPSSHLCPDG